MLQPCAYIYLGSCKFCECFHTANESAAKKVVFGQDTENTDETGQILKIVSFMNEFTLQCINSK